MRTVRRTSEGVPHPGLMQDFSMYQGQPPNVLLTELVRVTGELATSHEELALCRLGYENAYVQTMMRVDGSVAEREREARAAALAMKVSVLEVEAQVEVLRLEEALLRFLYAEALRCRTINSNG